MGFALPTHAAWWSLCENASRPTTICSRCSRLQRLNRVPFVSVERIDREVYQEWLSREARPLEIECNYNGVADHWLVAFLGMSPPRQSPFIQSKCRLKLVSNVPTYVQQRRGVEGTKPPFRPLVGSIFEPQQYKNLPWLESRRRRVRYTPDLPICSATTHSVDLCTLSE